MEEAMKKEVAELIATAVKGVTDQVGQIAEAVKPVSALVAEVESLKKSGAGVKLEDLNKAIAEAVAKAAPAKGPDEAALKALVAAEADSRAQAAQKEADAQAAGAALTAKRTGFAAEQLKNIPARYHAELGDDEAKWADQAKAIRTAFADEMKAAGVKLAGVGGDAGGAAIEGQATGGGFLKMPAPPATA